MGSGRRRRTISWPTLFVYSDYTFFLELLFEQRRHANGKHSYYTNILVVITYMVGDNQGGAAVRAASARR